jgi:hypothetical protein
MPEKYPLYFVLKATYTVAFLFYKLGKLFSVDKLVNIQDCNCDKKHKR